VNDEHDFPFVWFRIVAPGYPEHDFQHELITGAKTDSKGIIHFRQPEVKSSMTGKRGSGLSEIVNEPQVLAFVLPSEGAIPNSQLPLLFYRGAVKVTADPAGTLEELFEANDWGGTWRNGIYTYHHYHSTTHEVLGVFRGAATVQLGGERGIKQKINAGDVIIIPAGVAHKNFGASSDFGVVGGYPGGAEWDMNYGRPDERPAAERNLARVPLPKTDPVYGHDGPLFKHWLPQK
jgi:uncharacterized protein YjlB